MENEEYYFKKKNCGNCEFWDKNIKPFDKFYHGCTKRIIPKQLKKCHDNKIKFCTNKFYYCDKWKLGTI